MLVISLCLERFDSMRMPAYLEFACEERSEILRPSAKYNTVNVYHSVTQLDCEVREGRVAEVRVAQIAVAGHGGR